MDWCSTSVTSLDSFAAANADPNLGCRVCKLPKELLAILEANERRKGKARHSRPMVVNWLKTEGEYDVTTDIIYNHVSNNHMEPAE